MIAVNLIWRMSGKDDWCIEFQKAVKMPGLLPVGSRILPIMKDYDYGEAKIMEYCWFEGEPSIRCHLEPIRGIDGSYKEVVEDLGRIGWVAMF